ncbi:MAG TPA: hypothetical protein VGD62_03715 [Acidobacteriaceae bacterium]
MTEGGDGGGCAAGACESGRRVRAWILLGVLGWSASALGATWRAATAEELSRALPQRAPVLAERIETEMRSASGVIDEQGRLLAGVVLITAGYSANGKYADYLLVQAPIRVGQARLAPGGYLLGWTRVADDLVVTISEASTGKEVTQVPAKRNESLHRVEQLRVWPAPHGMIQLGRFTFDYALADR